MGRLKKWNKLLACCLALIMLTAMTACGDTADSEGTGGKESVSEENTSG